MSGLHFGSVACRDRRKPMNGLNQPSELPSPGLGQNHCAIRSGSLQQCHRISTGASIIRFKASLFAPSLKESSFDCTHVLQGESGWGGDRRAPTTSQVIAQAANPGDGLPVHAIKAFWHSRTPASRSPQGKTRSQEHGGRKAVMRTLLALLAAPLLGSASEPEYAQVVFENDHVRVVELFAGQGTKVSGLIQNAGVLVSVNKVVLQSHQYGGTPVIEHLGEGQVRWQASRNLRSFRVLAGSAHLFLVEVKSVGKKKPPAFVHVERDHSTVVDPDQHHLILDNDHVRVIDGMGTAGGSSALHSHPPSVLISLKKSRFKVTINGKTRIFDFEPATVRWTNHFEHRWQILSGDARVVMVEIKSAHTDPAFRRRY
jgi:hypothetical protein